MVSIELLKNYFALCSHACVMMLTSIEVIYNYVLSEQFHYAIFGCPYVCLLN